MVETAKAHDSFIKEKDEESDWIIAARKKRKMSVWNVQDAFIDIGLQFGSDLNANTFSDLWHSGFSVTVDPLLSLTETAHNPFSAHLWTLFNLTL